MQLVARMQLMKCTLRLYNMRFILDVVINTPLFAVDMKAGLASLQGVSDATRCVVESVLAEKVPKRLHHKGRVRTSLRETFKGSYGQVFSLDIHDEALDKKFFDIGKKTMVELISYFINESLYLETTALTDKAQKIVDKLGGTSEEIVNQLRVSSLENIHKISEQFNQGIQIRYRASRINQTVIAQFDRDTAKVLKAETSIEPIDITISVTRLNIYTGNGRLHIKDEFETVAFGFDIEYSEVDLDAKKRFSENLNFNNGITCRDQCQFLKISVLAVTLKDEKIVKYIVKGIYDD